MALELDSIEAEIVSTLETVAGFKHVRGSEPLGIIPALPCAYIRWLGATPVDVETGGGQDVTHAWRLEIDVAVLPDQEEEAQDALQALVQGMAAAFRDAPQLGGLVDRVRLSVSSEAEYFRRANLAGDPTTSMLYGMAYRLE